MAGLFDPTVFQPNTFQNDSAAATNVFQKCLFQPGVFQTDVCEAEVETGGGSGYPVYGKYKRPKGIGEFLDVAMSEIYAEATKKTTPLDKRKEYAEIVKPYSKQKKEIPATESIDWSALEKDVERVSKLLELWEQQIIEDDDLIIQAYMEYYY